MQPLNSNSQCDHDDPATAPTRRPLRTRLCADIGADVHAAAQEFVGTTLFLTLAFGGVQASLAEVADSSSTTAGGGGAAGVTRVMYVALCFGFSLLVAAWLFFRVSGGLFNPNVAAALCLAGVIAPARCVLYCVAQLAGGIAAAALVYALTPGEIAFKCVSCFALDVWELRLMVWCGGAARSSRRGSTPRRASSSRRSRPRRCASRS